MKRDSFSWSRRVAAVVAVGGLLCLTSPAFASAPSDPGTPATAARHVTVETYNVDLGTNLKPLFEATSLPALVGAASTAYAEVLANDFPERATALASLIAKERPDVVGLQEVALWQTSSSGPYGPFTTSVDYLDLLLDALAAEGVPYAAVVQNPNFTGQAPVTLNLAGWVRYTDRNVVIVRTGPGVHLTTANPAQGVYAARIPVALPAPLPATAITRGWASVDVTTWGRTFRFVTTHLEAYGRFNGDDLFRNLQANELVSLLAASPYPVVLTGDINSQPTGCTPANVNTVAYGIITAAGFDEVWPAVHQQSPCTGFTSGQAGLLSPVSSIDHRIDDVFFQPASFTALQAEIVGEAMADRSVPDGFWPSDHASTVATLRMTNWS
jgi:endonuclease/exonuclease/phosphatase family metal-dependent hydrolase